MKKEGNILALQEDKLTNKFGLLPQPEVDPHALHSKAGKLWWHLAELTELSPAHVTVRHLCTHGCPPCGAGGECSGAFSHGHVQ